MNEGVNDLQPNPLPSGVFPTIANSVGPPIVAVLKSITYHQLSDISITRLRGLGVYWAPGPAAISCDGQDPATRRDNAGVVEGTCTCWVLRT